MSHCKLCNSITGSAGSVHDLDTLFFGIFVVDIVDADAAADDELQFAGFACRTMMGTRTLVAERTTRTSKFFTCSASSAGS